MISYYTNSYSMVYYCPSPLLPRRHYNAPCRVYRCTSVIGLTTMERSVRNSVICNICYKARKTIVNAWKNYIYIKRSHFLFLITQKFLKHSHDDINKLISVFLV